MSLLRNSIQAAVTSLDEGVGRSLIRGMLCVLLGATLFGLYGWSQFRGLQDATAMDAAQIARNLSQGKGFATQYIRPVDIWYMERQGKPWPNANHHYPDLRHAPLWPSFLAVGFKFLGTSFNGHTGADLFSPETRIIVPLGIVLSISTGILILLLGKTLFDDRSAFVTLLLLFLSPSFLKAAISGSCLPAATLFATATISFAFFSVRSLHNEAPWRVWLGYAALCGVFCAAACLTSYSMLILLPLVLIWFRQGFSEKRWPAIFALLLAFCLTFTPWLVRNLRVTGEPLGMAPYAAIEQSLLHPDNTFARTAEPTMHNVRIANAVKAKFKANALRMFYRGFGLPLAGIMAAFFLVSLFEGFDDPHTERLKWHVVLGLLLIALPLCLRGPAGPDLIQVFLPLIIVFGTGFFFAAVDRSEAYRSGWAHVFVIGVVGFTAIPFILTLTGHRASIPYPPYYPPLQAYAAGSVTPAETICTDIPEATAWYGNRPSLLLPATVDEFTAIHSAKMPCGALYLTSQTRDDSGNNPAWAMIMNRQIPSTFPFQEGICLPPGSDDQLLLTPTSPAN